MATEGHSEPATGRERADRAQESQLLFLVHKDLTLDYTGSLWSDSISLFTPELWRQPPVDNSIDGPGNICPEHKVSACGRSPGRGLAVRDVPALKAEMLGEPSGRSVVTGWAQE